MASAYRSSLQLAQYHSLRSLAFPSISTGAYGFPIARAAPLVWKTIASYLIEYDPPFEEIFLVLFQLPDAGEFASALRELSLPEPEESA